MKNWHLHIKTYKSWCIDKSGNHFEYDIHFLPNIELYYDSIMDCDNECYKESPRLLIQWLVWSLDIWFDYDEKRKYKRVDKTDDDIQEQWCSENIKQ